MMLGNPEFQRQLWLRWGPWHGLWLLLFVALAALVVAVLSAPGERLRNVLYVALLTMCLAPVFPGASTAGRSLQEELVQNTWDWQRLSALGPWQMAWGKLLGSTLPMWLLALVCAALAQALAWLWHLRLASLPPEGEDWAPLLAEPIQAHAHLAELVWLAPKLALLALLWGLALQAFAMASAPMKIDAERQRRNQPGMRVAVLVMLAWMLFSTLQQEQILDFGLKRWWGQSLGFFELGWLFGLAALGLNLLALWRTMGMRLDVPALPWAMPLGCMAAAAMLAGLWPHAPGARHWLVVTAYLALGCSLLTCLSQRETAFAQWRRVQVCWGQQRWLAGWQAMPLWPVSWCLAAAATLALLLWPAAGAGDGTFQRALPLLLLALLRDAGFVLLWALQPIGLRRLGPALSLGWVALGIMLPLMLLSTGNFPLALAVQPWLAPFMPPLRLDALHWLVLALQLGGMALLVWRAWRQRVAQLEMAGPQPR
ncbi:hypothetical protein [Vandammella animalimorsus]|uniref:Uncharacterized protein n=1 Tax=Vandammella animalimorsus TaxID=2029117 RepID=A0A2A2AJT9_9BURK|nr:hypothetical protein [Vandammella animalimorsus]PAT37991.1 hypothetical protein CK625_00120 [Vandammella animalimorsus]